MTHEKLPSSETMTLEQLAERIRACSRKKAWVDWSKEMRGFADRIEVIAAERREREGYRWVRNNNGDSFDGTPHILSWHTGCNYVYFNTAADAAIDAAMQGESHDH